MNNITIAGQLGRDSEIKTTGSGDSILSFSVADSQGGRDKPAIWWACSLWGKRADSLAPYLVKGTAVTVSGTVTEREWTDKEGNKRKSMDVRVNDVMLQGGRKQSDHQEEAPRPARAAAPQPALVDDGDVPF